MKIRHVVAPMLIAAMILSGCGSGGNPVHCGESVGVVNGSQAETSNNTGLTSKSDIEHISRTLSSGVEVDADMMYPSGMDFSSLSTYKAIIQEFDLDKNQEVITYGRNIQSSEIHDDARDLYGELGEYRYDVFEDGGGCTLNKYMVSLSSLLSQEITFGFVEGPGSPGYNIDTYLTGKIFDFATIEEAFQDIKAEFKKMDIEISDYYTCYSMDYETLNQESARLKALREGHGKALKLTEEDNCYKFSLFASAGGYPITGDSTGSADKGGFEFGSMVSATYSKDGIIDMCAYAVYEVTDTAKKEAGCLSAEELIGKIDEKYNSIIMDGTIKVTSIEFMYFPIGISGSDEVELVPGWKVLAENTFMIQSKENPDKMAEISMNITLRFNGVTGEEILGGENGGIF